MKNAAAFAGIDMLFCQLLVVRLKSRNGKQFFSFFAEARTK